LGKETIQQNWKACPVSSLEIGQAFEEFTAVKSFL